MPTIRETTGIKAPLARIFALSTNVALVQRTLGMSLIEGPASIEQNSRVHWRGWKFGLPTSHHTLITQFVPPHRGTIGDAAAEFDGQDVAWFEDSQERGRFSDFHHMHLFRQYRHEVRLEDIVYFELPFGFAGRLVATHIMAPYIRKLTRTRFAMLKRIAESEEWRNYLP
jgi:ligand-binding SRPBCC domain-containing protein